MFRLVVVAWWELQRVHLVAQLSTVAVRRRGSPCGIATAAHELTACCVTSEYSNYLLALARKRYDAASQTPGRQVSIAHWLPPPELVLSPPRPRCDAPTLPIHGLPYYALAPLLPPRPSPGQGGAASQSSSSSTVPRPGSSLQSFRAAANADLRDPRRPMVPAGRPNLICPSPRPSSSTATIWPAPLCAPPFLRTQDPPPRLRCTPRADWRCHASPRCYGVVAQSRVACKARRGDGPDESGAGGGCMMYIRVWLDGTAWLERRLRGAFLWRSCAWGGQPVDDRGSERASLSSHPAPTASSFIAWTVQCCRIETLGLVISDLDFIFCHLHAGPRAGGQTQDARGHVLRAKARPFLHSSGSKIRARDRMQDGYQSPS